ncbi:hypothetical protein RvY_04627 [Ramazzottius varieornatus]|uniref:Major facilitator superfamily (MFS) profile domain-containing protein n=1 Tax=Ramazzottius varieornatus TaxID=947166 RepID=A0A1D1V1F7_RAMVA|nr:hypothetical protein RvY_04627 [Ramazzottius varieornatus]
MEVLDTGWSWIVLLLSCFVSMICDGIRSSSAIFYSQFIDNLNLTPRQSASVVALFYSMFFLSGPLAGLSASRFGTKTTVLTGTALMFAGLLTSAFVHSYWALLITFGFLHGLGQCMVIIPSLGALPLWFSKYRQLATASFMATGGVGIFLIAPLVQLLVDRYTWRGSVIVLAGIILHGVVAVATFLSRSRNATHHTVDLELSVVLGDLVVNPCYWLKIFSTFFTFGVSLLPIFVMRHLTEYRGYTAAEAATLLSLIGMTSFAGRVSFVVLNFNLKTATKNNRFVVFNLSALLSTVASGLLPLMWSYPAVAAICGVLGFVKGVRIASMAGVTLDIASPTRFQTAFSIEHFFGGVSALAVPPIVGLLAETYKSYHPAFYMASVGFFIAFVLGLFIQYIEYSKKTAAQHLAKSSLRQTAVKKTSKLRTPILLRTA